MGVFLIAYDSPTQNYAPLARFANQFDAMRFSDCAYAVRTDLSADQLYRQLQPLLAKDEVVYVIALVKPWIGYGYEAMNDWLKRHLDGKGL